MARFVQGVAVSGLLLLSACAERAMLSEQAGTGPAPKLPPPKSAVIPTVNIAPAQPWSGGAKPVAAAGLHVTAFAGGLDHPRWLHVLPNGDVLVAESNRPSAAEGARSGVAGWFMRKFMQRAGAGGPSANRITLLRDADGNGIPELRTVFLEGLNSPFGMAHVGDTLFVANTDAVLRFPYKAGATRISDPGEKLADLPAGRINHHWTKGLIAGRDGKRLYATVGSNSNVGELGMENEANRAAILEIDAASGATRVFASGLRNPNGLAWNPRSGALWTTVNERDEIGSDLVPDYMTSVKEGGFYGWPYSYFGQNVDTRVKPPRPDLVASAIVPDYALGAHVAAFGLAFYQAGLLPARYAEGAFIALHGSWNRRPHSGYKVVFVPFADGRPAGPPVDILTGFLSAEGKAQGRPIGIAVDRSGALLVSDDVGNVVWRVTAAR